MRLKEPLVFLAACLYVASAAAAELKPPSDRAFALELEKIRLGLLDKTGGKVSPLVPAAPVASVPVQRVHRPGVLPVHGPDPNCRNLPHVYVRNRILYRNGVEIGRDPRSFQASCNGDVGWQDSWGRMHKNADQLHSNQALAYSITRYSGHIVWTASYGELYRDSEELTNSGTDVVSYKVSDWTGDVAWEGSYRKLYKNKAELTGGSFSLARYDIAQYTGDVVWQDSWGDLYKNSAKLGRAERYEFAPTGDVAWQEFMRRLHKNDRLVTQDFTRWTLRQDGLLVWWDSWEREYSE